MLTQAAPFISLRLKRPGSLPETEAAFDDPTMHKSGSRNGPLQKTHEPVSKFHLAIYL